MGQELQTQSPEIGNGWISADMRRGEVYMEMIGNKRFKYYHRWALGDLDGGKTFKRVMLHDMIVMTTPFW